METRANTIREISGRRAELFCSTANQLFERYGEVSGVAEPDHGHQAMLADFILSFAGRALPRAWSRTTKARTEHIMAALDQQVRTEVEGALRAPQQATAGAAPLNATTERAATGILPTPGSATVAPISARAAATVTSEPIIISDDEKEEPSPIPAVATPSHSELDHSLSLSHEDSIRAAVKKAAFIVAQGGPHHIQRAARSLSSAPLAPLTSDTMA